MLRRYFADPYVVAGTAIYMAFVVVSLVAGWLAPYDPTEILFTDDGQLAASLPPSAAHWLRPTNLGRGIF